MFNELIFEASHMYIKLSFPPLASTPPSNDHFKSHTSSVCAFMHEVGLFLLLSVNLQIQGNREVIIISLC
jgi:hypothetical protein